MKKFAVFDIDGTLIRWQLYHAVTDALARAGHIKPEAYQAMRKARMDWKRRSGGSFRDYEMQVVRVYETTIKTIKKSELELAMDSVFDEYKDQVYIFTRDLINQIKEQGYSLLAISGSPTEMVARIADYYGFAGFVGSEYEYRGERIIGNKSVGARDKDRSLKKLVQEYGLDFKDSIGVGDSLSDIKMLELVDNPIAFNPERELFEQAKAKGWKIVLERKNMIYELEPANGHYQLGKTN